MSSVRLIPCLDIKDRRVVKGVKFEGIVDAGDPIELARAYGQQGADELIFLDISASVSGLPAVVDLAAAIAEEVFIPFTVGGGLRSLADVRAALLAGADKVSLNSAALADPALIQQCSDSYGSQCVVLAVDAKRVRGGWEVMSHGGTIPTGRDVIAWLQEGVAAGAGEVLLTSMDSDGTQQGYDLELLKAAAQSVSVPLIASGGAGEARHLIAAVNEGKADAVLLAGILHRGTQTIQGLKDQMAAAGIAVRQSRQASY